MKIWSLEVEGNEINKSTSLTERQMLEDKGKQVKTSIWHQPTNKIPSTAIIQAACVFLTCYVSLICTIFISTTTWPTVSMDYSTSDLARDTILFFTYPQGWDSHTRFTWTEAIWQTKISYRISTRCIKCLFGQGFVNYYYFSNAVFQKTVSGKITRYFA